MSNSETEIANLLYRYAELLDGGNLQGVAELFRHAQIKLQPGDERVGADELLCIFREQVKLYPCGTPRTKHLVTNPIIEVDEASHRATARSYYTVLQGTDNLPLQPIATGRYHDAFERIDGVWRFSFRDYSMLDMVGNLSGHLNGAAAS
ncbi:nuclear transport factor 2 family protein [Pseudomonas sp. LFM046]|uniref:nuclear transport factor 2 family protein n=1 Tax=Pseudomonas sp. LFM046 TaxID=1608357 RepID=UPI0005CFA997|nr:nuclear transport factor 2 family protein [Pseudomonas sp. LFM046]